MGRRAARAARGGRTRDRPLARLILDTSLLVDAERHGLDPFASLIGDEDDVAVSAITVAELKVGVELADGRRRKAREGFVAAVIGAVTVEVYDLGVAEAHAALLTHARRSGRLRGAHDLIIAATARARRREILTYDIEGFADLPEVVVRTTLT